MHSLKQLLPIIAQKIRSATGWFIWQGHILRISRPQLILPKIRGGLNLIDPGIKANCLYLKKNLQHLTGQGDKYSETFLKLWVEENRIKNPPNLTNLPKCAPYIKILIQSLSYLPHPMPEPLSTKILYTSQLQQIPNPSIIQQCPNFNWKQIWRNIHNKALTSTEISLWYKVIHNVIPTNERLHHIKMLASPNCNQCGTPCSRLQRYIHLEYNYCRSELRKLTNMHIQHFSFQTIYRPTFQFKPLKKHYAVVKMLTNVPVLQNVI